MRKKTFLKGLFASLPLIAAGAAIVLALPGHVLAEGQDFSSIGRTRRAEAHDFSTAVEAEELSVKIVSSSESSEGQFLEIAFSTGGVCYQDIKPNYRVAPSDPAFDAYFAEFSAMSKEQLAEIEEKAASGEYEAPLFQAFMQSFVLKENNLTELVLPKALYRGVYWGLQPIAMVDKMFDAWDEKTVTDIFIPETMAEISAEAFDGIDPAKISFHAESAAALEGWESGWNHGAPVSYGYDYDGRFGTKSTTSSKSLPRMQTSAIQFGDENVNFYLGYYAKGSEHPLTLQYHLKGEAPTAAYHEFEFEKKSENLDYDAVGASIYNFSNNLFCDIPLGDDEAIDMNSLRIQNIFPAAKANPSDPWAPDFNQPLFADPAISYAHSYALENFVIPTFLGFTTFDDFTMVRMKMALSDEEIYPVLKSAMYNSYRGQLASGAVYIRYRLTSISTSYLQFYLEGGEVIETRLSSPVSQVVLSEKENNVSFLVKNSDLGPAFKSDAVRKVNLLSLYVTVDLFAENGPVARSGASTRFGIVSVMPLRTEAPAIFSIGLFLIIEAIAYVIFFVLGTAILYFYRKAKYKNDEFLRVKPKQFFLHAGLALVAAYFVVLALTAIILRTSVFANAVVVYNPLDAFIIIFGILSILVIGYFAKYLVGAVKARNERNRVRRLKLNEDVPDDGTNL